MTARVRKQFIPPKPADPTPDVTALAISVVKAAAARRHFVNPFDAYSCPHHPYYDNTMGYAHWSGPTMMAGGEVPR
jgi:hypothetical protein